MSRPLVNELWEYSYDLADQLESITVTVDAGSPTLLESFESDEDGNMLTRDKGGVVTEYRWDSQNRLTQVKVDGDVVVRSIYDAFMQGHQLLGVEQGGNLHYYLVDGLANVRLVLDSSGSIVASTVFDEFGIPEDVSGSADLRPHGYTGGLGVRNDWDSSDLHYMRHRYYDPQLGRWLSADPIGFAGGLNLYTYVGQNPINASDPSGLDETHQSYLRQFRDRLSRVPGELGEQYLYMLHVWSYSTPSGIIENQMMDHFAADGGTGVEAIRLIVMKGNPSAAAKSALKRALKGSGNHLPEDALLTGKRHGVFWHDADAIARAVEKGKPQGRFNAASLHFANDEVQKAVGRGDLKVGGAYLTVPLPDEINADVFLPNGKRVRATSVTFGLNKNGTWHGYPSI